MCLVYIITLLIPPLGVLFVSRKYALLINLILSFFFLVSIDEFTHLSRNILLPNEIFEYSYYFEILAFFESTKLIILWRIFFWACALFHGISIVNSRKEEKEEENKKSRKKAVLYCMFLGFLGIHRFYLGYTLIGIIQFLTGGGFLIWMIVDYQAEMQKLLEILVHSLYTEREIFLRELVSNASDALSKVQLTTLTEEKVLGYTLIGIIQFLTGGGFLIWMIVDFVRLITGSLRPVDWEDFDEIFFGSEWMETQLKQQLLDHKEYQDAVEAGDKAGAKASKLSLKRQIEWWNASWNKQRLRSDKEYRDAVNAGDKDAAKVRKIRLGGEIVDEKLREEGRECRDLGKPFCAWCMFPDYCMEFVEGEASAYIWKYRNKDGSKDMRVNDNSQSAGYTSEWLCKECGAKTTVQHYMRKNPSKDVEAWKVTLNSNGSGKRFAKDWESDEVSFVKKREAHRKGDN